MTTAPAPRPASIINVRHVGKRPFGTVAVEKPVERLQTEFLVEIPVEDVLLERFLFLEVRKMLLECFGHDLAPTLVHHLGGSVGFPAEALRDPDADFHPAHPDPRTGNPVIRSSAPEQCPTARIRPAPGPDAPFHGR